MALLVKKLNEEAMIPTRGSAMAAGADLYALEEVILQPKTRALVRTGIAVEIPPEYYGRIAPRSGVSVQTGLLVNAGVIDSDYRGELKILFQNFSEEEVKIAKGAKVAQLILEQVGILPILEVDDLDVSERGENGFGSTGST